MQAAEARLYQLDYELCPHCEYRTERDFVRCPHCLRKLKDRCASCTKPLDPTWTMCPYCETEVASSTRTRRRRTTTEGETAAARAGAESRKSRSPRESAPSSSRAAADRPTSTELSGDAAEAEAGAQPRTRTARPGGEVIGCDFSEEMLLRARVKAPDLRFDSGNVLDLQYGDDEFDAVTVGFGARNFADLERGLREMTRVVRPGGRVLVLDFTTPQRPPLSTFFHLWFDRVVPLLGRLVGAPDAYGYLSHSVRRFPPPAKLAELMDSCGMCSIRYIITGGGIVTMHVGTVVASGAPARSNGHHTDAARA
jgi:ubiquinone/menaquinone biosynthesis methyltransferase